MANYNDDFSSYPIASGVPTGFTARWVTASVTHSIVDSTGDEDNKSFRQNRSANGRGLVTIDSVDGDSNRADAEVLVRIRSVNPTAGQAQGGPALRCSGAAATETGYVCYPISNRLRIARYRSGTSDPALAESGTLGLTADTWYWVRFRANGTGSTVTLSAKIWAGALGDEPGTPSTGWTVTHSDSSSQITAAGWCGMFAFGTSNWDTDAIAVGTNGDTATFGAAGITGTGSNTVGAFTQAATGEVTGAGDITGSGANTVGPFTQASAGASTIVGSGANTVGAFTQASAGTVPIVGSGANTVGTFTQVAAGVAGSAPILGAGANTVGAFTQVAAGTVASVGGTLSIGPVKNNTGTVLTALTIPKLAILRLSDMSLVLNLTSQTTNGSGFITVTNVALVGGTGYVGVLANNDGSSLGTFYGAAS